MDGISIRYDYNGNEDEWREAVNTFIDAVNDDPDIAGKFHYAVSVAGDGVLRSHTGRWDSQETHATLQSRDYFKTFAGKRTGMAGDSPDAKQITLFRNMS